MDTLDTYCERNGIERIDLLKIDTEGSEIAVLQGASRMLSSDAIRFVYAEFNEILPIPGVVGSGLVPLAEILSPFGLSLWRPTPTGSNRAVSISSSAMSCSCAGRYWRARERDSMQGCACHVSRWIVVVELPLQADVTPSG